MRLHLTIKRHELPPAKILFPLPDRETSVSKLLELVNDVVPLESEQWGLEDYTLTVLDYECLHYQDAHALLKEGDQVEIRPLSTAETKARRTSGRLQVSAAGARLVDGVAFGRSYDNRSRRPPVYIPPLKRRRVLEAGEDRVDAAHFEQHVQVRHEHDTSLRPSEQEEEPKQQRLSADRRSSSVKFAAPEEDGEDGDDGESESDDEDYEETSISSSSSQASRAYTPNFSSEGDGESDSDSDSASTSSSEPSSSSASSSSSESTGSEADSQTLSPSSVTQHKAADAAPAGSHQRPVAPGNGLSRTRSRNKRRRESKLRLKAAMQEHKASGKYESHQNAADCNEPPSAELEAKRMSLMNAITGLGQDNPPEELHEDDASAAQWHEVIALSAVECRDEGVELSAPPFPFKQRWDPQYRFRPTKGKKRKRTAVTDDPNTYSAQGLPYDDNEDGNVDYSMYRGADDYEADGHLIPSSQAHLDDPEIPDLPEDLSSLPPVEQRHLQSGAVIVFRQFEVSSSTGWQPGFSQPKTALILNFDQNSTLLKVRLARRDQRQVKRDEYGSRIYEGFEMPAPDGEDSEDADSVVEVALGECTELRLLVAAKSQSLSVEDGGAFDTELVQDSVNRAQPISEESDPIGTEKLTKSAGGDSQRESQATSIASNGGAIQDQAAQIRASMMDAQETIDTSMEMITSRDSQVEATPG